MLKKNKNLSLIWAKTQIFYNPKSSPALGYNPPCSGHTAIVSLKQNATLSEKSGGYGNVWTKRLCNIHKWNIILIGIGGSWMDTSSINPPPNKWINEINKKILSNSNKVLQIQNSFNMQSTNKMAPYHSAQLSMLPISKITYYNRYVTDVLLNSCVILISLVKWWIWNIYHLFCRDFIECKESVLENESLALI